MKRKSIAILMALCLVCSGFPVAAFAESGLIAGTIDEQVEEKTHASDNVVDNEFFVISKGFSAVRDVAEAVDSLEENDIDVEKVENLDNGIFHFSTESDEDNSYEEIAEIVEDDSDVVVAPVVKYKTSKTADHFLSQTSPIYGSGAVANDHSAFGGNSMDKVMDLVADAKNSASTATVAVIDSGFCGDHEGFKNRVYNDYSASVADFGVGYIVGDGAEANEIEADNVHGTMVASIIANNLHHEVDPVDGCDWYFHGATEKTKLVLVNAWCGDTSTDNINLIKAFNYIDSLIESGKITDMKAINMSLGSTWSPELLAAEEGQIQGTENDPLYIAMKSFKEKRKDVAIVCSSGNDGIYGFEEGWKNFPADYDCCISVASGSEDYYDCFSSLNMNTDIAARGVCIEGAAPESQFDKAMDIYRRNKYHIDHSADTNDENCVQGTSFSAPLVTSALVSLMQLDPSLSPKDALALLKETASPAKDFYNRKTSCVGIMNAEKAAFFVMKKLGKASEYWVGMNDIAEASDGNIYGYRVTSAKNNEVQIIHMSEFSKNKKNMVFPSKVRLGDGALYTVTSVCLNQMHNCSHVNGESITIPNTFKNVSCIAASAATNLKTLTVKTKNLDSASKIWFWFNTIDTVIVDIPNASHAVNVKYLNKLKSAFIKKGRCKVKNFRTSTKATSIASNAHSLKINFAKKGYTYDGKAKKPTVSSLRVKVNGAYKTLKKNTDFTVSYKKNKNAGKATVTVKGKGNYSGTLSKNFTIKKASIKKAKIKKLVVRKKDGKLYVSSVQLAIGKTAIGKKNYSATCKKYGKKAKVTLKGRNNLSGSATKVVKVS